MTKDLITTVSSGVTEIWGQEQILWSKKYKLAGRTDMVGLWKDIPSIIDFKTSKKKKSISQIRDYFLQCCFYAVSHNEMYGTGIRQGVIAITVDDDEPQLFKKDLAPFLYEFKNRRAEYEMIKAFFALFKIRKKPTEEFEAQNDPYLYSFLYDPED